MLTDWSTEWQNKQALVDEVDSNNVESIQNMTKNTKQFSVDSLSKGWNISILIEDNIRNVDSLWVDNKR